MSNSETGDRKAFVRSEGGTASERYLAKLCDRTFLDLWSYPNVYIDKRKGGKGDGKELCDLLVVCGDHVIIFSDKTIGWHGDIDVQLAWSRWFNRAVHHSVKQIRKAERWIDQMPDKIYLDKSCTQPFPFPLPPPERRKVHGVVVALGAGEACRHFFEEGNGSLMITPDIQGEAHFQGENVQPFAIGDVDPDGPFIHVLDDATLDIALSELDTITDLTDYLTKKAALIRSDKLVTAGGEEDLIAYYATHVSPAGEHDFTTPDGRPLGENDGLILEPGQYEAILADPQYGAKKDADRVSYVWDNLIKAFTDHMIAGTSITIEGQPFVLSESEQAVRHMALVPRFARRVYGMTILDAIDRGKNEQRFTRTLMPGPFSVHQDTAFFFTTLAVPKLDVPDPYERYRVVRRNLLSVQSFALLKKYPTLKRVVGIATEPQNENGSSEDIILVEDIVWTPELTAEVEELMKFYNVMQEGNIGERRFDEWEFPRVAQPAAPRYPGPPGMTRRERRAMKAQQRRRR